MSKKDNEAAAGAEQVVGIENNVDPAVAQAAAEALLLLGVDVSNMKVSAGTPLAEDDIALTSEENGEIQDWVSPYQLARKKAGQTGRVAAYLLGLSGDPKVTGCYVIRDEKTGLVSGFRKRNESGYVTTEYTSVTGGAPCGCPSNRKLALTHVVMTERKGTIADLRSGRIPAHKCPFDHQNVEMGCLHEEARDVLVNDFEGKVPSGEEVWTWLQIKAAKTVPWMRGFKNQNRWFKAADDTLQKFMLEQFEDRRKAIFGIKAAEKEAEAEAARLKAEKKERKAKKKAKKEAKRQKEMEKVYAAHLAKSQKKGLFSRLFS